MEIESSATATPTVSTMAVPTNPQSIAKAIGAEYEDLVMQDACIGPDSNSVPSSQQVAVEGGKAAP